MYLLAQRIVDRGRGIAARRAWRQRPVRVAAFRVRRPGRGPGPATSRCGSPSSRRAGTSCPPAVTAPTTARTSRSGTRTARTRCARSRTTRRNSPSSLSYTPEVGDLYRHEAGAVRRRAAVQARGAADRPVGGDAAGVPARYSGGSTRWTSPGSRCRGVEPARTPRCRRTRSSSGRRSTPRCRASCREGRATSALAVRGVPSLEDFGMVLPAVIAAAGRHYLRSASTHLPQEPHEPDEAPQ